MTSHEIAGKVALTKTKGMETVTLTGSGKCSAIVTLFGAHVVSWTDPSGTERLFMSPLAPWDGKKSFRGGIPVCWPQFATDGPLAKHGFARTATWTLSGSSASDNGDVEAVFVFKSTDVPDHGWAGEATYTYSVALKGGSLVLTSDVKNTGAAPCSFSNALHTYFAVGNVGATRVTPLKGLKIFDKVKNEAGTESADELTFNGEFDRKFFGAPNRLTIHNDGGDGGRFMISKEGYPDAVIWNPGKDNAMKMSDLGEHFAGFVCVESACIEPNPVVLKPGDTWSGTKSITYLPK